MSLLEQLERMPTLGVALPWQGFVRYRASGTELKKGVIPTVLLHGIGSGSGSWLCQLQDQQLGAVLAWDAPGYADSSALKSAEPEASDYARVMWAWLDTLDITQVHLVGHSLGCIMAASAARLQASRVKALTLLAPAQGYGPASAEVQQKKRDERNQAVALLGMQKMAEQRAPRLLSKQARAEHLALATDMMSRLNPGGYAQATHMLSLADIRADLAAFRSVSKVPIQVACGDEDVITPPEACRDLAQWLHAPYTSLPGAGHLCAIEAAQALQSLLIPS
jgi:pimeloyl-ACP methyl ester carboxylesterase